MKIVNIIGGLGNQMFQYAFALSLQERFPEEEVLIDISHYGHLFFNRYKGSNLHNGYEIGKVFPHTNMPVAKPNQLMRVTWYMPNYFVSRILRRILPVRRTEIVQSLQDSYAYNKCYYEVKGDCYYEGYWQSARNFIPIRDKICHVYSHGDPNEINSRYIHIMESSNSVGLHIRRGDYVEHALFKGICDLCYYEKGIKEILHDGKDHVFFIFSNDIQWCEEHIAPLLEGHEFFFINQNVGIHSCWDMFLMTYCKDLVIANSSFSWWGAFLNNRGGRVVAPKVWINGGIECDIWLDDWIRL